MAATVPHLDISVDISAPESVEAGARSVVSHVRPDWSQTSVKVFSAGVTNKLVGVYDANCEDKYEDMVLVRCYGYKTDLLIDRDAEIRNMKLMHSHGVGAQLMATFNNGISYEFLKGETLTPESVVRPDIYPLVAKAMRTLHEIPVEGASQEASIWKILRKFHALSPDGFPEDPDKDQRYKSKVLSKDQLLDEIVRMEKLLRPDADEKCRMVFCHNDALLENIVVNGDIVNFIDYEYGDTNYREIDIAGHFGEFPGVDADFLDYDKHYPTKEFQLSWIREYLGEGATQKEVEELQRMVDRFSALPHLMWGIWSLIQSKNSNIDFDFLGYAILRLDFYKRRRQLASIRGHLSNSLLTQLYGK